MQVTEVRVKLMARKNERLKAFCSVTFDGEFVVRDVKVIEGTSGLFVAMPSRRLADRCPACRNKNPLKARFCSECGAHLDEGRIPRDGQGRMKLHVDIAHPINAACRQGMEKAILLAYEHELERSQQPDYVPQKLYDEDEDLAEETTHPAPASGQAAVTEQQKPAKTKDEQEHKFGEGIL